MEERNKNIVDWFQIMRSYKMTTSEIEETLADMFSCTTHNIHKIYFILNKQPKQYTQRVTRPKKEKREHYFYGGNPVYPKKSVFSVI